MSDTENMFGKEYIVKVTDDGECITVGRMTRCKDCMWYEIDRKMVCGFGGHGAKQWNDYCSYAEAKGENRGKAEG